MKTLLEQIIYAALFEQQTGRIKKVEAPASAELIRHNAVRPASRKALAAARQHGSVLSGWSAFTIKSIYVRKTDAKSVSNDPELLWTDSSGAAEAVRQATQDTKDEQYYGVNGHFNTATTDGTPKYMYIVGPDVAKRERVRKHNVWVCNFEQLYSISKQLNKQAPLEYYIKLENLVKSKKANIGNIIVFDFKDIATWFSVLSQRIKQAGLNIKPEDSKVLIPELQYLSTDYDPESEKIDTTPKTIEIDDSNSEQYNYPNFIGTAKLQYDSLGNRVIVPIKGSLRVTKTGTDISGMFNGEFKNGAPWKGYIDFEDDTIFPYGELTNPKVTIDAEGNRNFSFTGEWQDKPVDPQTEPDGEKIDTTLDTSVKTTYTYPYTLQNGLTVYTMSNTDPYVYIYLTPDNVWQAGKKSVFETGEETTFKTISNPSAITKLNNLIK
jgi:hypothetical protein